MSRRCSIPRTAIISDFKTIIGTFRRKLALGGSNWPACGQIADRPDSDLRNPVKDKIIAEQTEKTPGSVF